MKTMFHSDYAVLSRRATLVIFLVMIFCFVVLAFRTELADREIQDNNLQIQVAQWRSCIGGQEIIKRFNDQQEKLALIEEEQDIDPALRERRIKVYKEGVVPLPQCGPEPRTR